ncbi:MAG: hypothetical protein OHK0015_46090 [Chloroflexi bacterium OHK40]
MRPGFQLAGPDATAVARICRLVDGLPLAIELVVGWAKALSCAAIADELERGLGLLNTTLRNVAERWAEAFGQPRNLAPAWLVSGEAAWFQGRYQDAQRCAERAYANTDQAGAHWALALCLIVLGNAAVGLGRYEQAEAGLRVVA